MSSNHLRTLRQQAKELQPLLSDITPLAAESVSWARQVEGTIALETQVPVEAWHLVAHFLATYADWIGLLNRYLQYFAADVESLSDSGRAWRTRAKN